MKKNVLITVRGTQSAPGSSPDVIEITVPGEYHLKGNRHFLIYDQLEEDNVTTTHNIVRCQNGFMEVTKRGAVNSVMRFENGKDYTSNYRSPFGEILMDFHTKKVTVEEKDNLLRIQALYSLSVDGAFVSDSKLQIKVTPQGEGVYKL